MVSPTLTPHEILVQEAMEFWALQRDTLIDKHPGKYLTISGQTLHGVFDTRAEATQEGLSAFPSDAFIVRCAAYPDPRGPVMVPSFTTEGNA